MQFPLARRLQRSQWSIRTKLMGGFLLIAFIIMILTAFSVWVIGDLGQKINEVAQAQARLSKVADLADGVTEFRNSLQNISLDVTNIASRSSDVVAVGADPDTVYRNYQLYVLDYQRQRNNLTNARMMLNESKRSFAVSQMTMPVLDNFFKLSGTDLQSTLDQFDKLHEAALSKQFKAIGDIWQSLQPRSETILNQVDQLRADLVREVDQTQRATTKAVEDANNARSWSQVALLFAGIAAVILSIGLGSLLTVVFTRPLERLRRRLVRLSEGDLATILEVRNRDQFGDLAGTFNQSIARLGGVVEQVQHQSHRVSSAAAEIATASSHSAMVSVEQAGAVAEATVTIEELSHTAQQIAEAATLVANAAEQALSSASDGQETVRESIVGINNLKNRVRNITDRILALSERSQRVGHIIEQVASIADQTHLLALNAAIESAAAGESGKRFAVVAASVKQLAERSRQATKDVQAVLSEIQTATNASVMATEQGMKEAERGVTLAHRTGDANESIIQMVERTVQLASAISLATQQQRSASEQVVSSMRQLATVIQDGASSAKQSSSLATSLDEVALELQRLSSQFKVAPRPPVELKSDADNDQASLTTDSSETNPPVEPPLMVAPALRPEPAS